jgi:hypothetical protein
VDDDESDERAELGNPIYEAFLLLRGLHRRADPALQAAPRSERMALLERRFVD